MWFIRVLMVFAGLLYAEAAVACPPLEAEQVMAITVALVQERAVKCHPDVRAAEHQLQGAQADVLIANQAPNPQLTLGAGSVGHWLGSRPFWDKTFDHSARVDQLIERGNKRGLRRAAAESTREAVSADARTTRHLAVAQAIGAHQDLWAAQQRLEQLTDSAQLSSRSLQLIDERIRTGDAPARDGDRLRADDAHIQGDLRQAQADLIAARATLAYMLDVLPQADALQVVTEPMALPAQADLDVVLDRRSDIEAARARLSSATQSRRLADALRTRDVTVSLQADHWPVSPQNMSGTGDTLSLSLSVPLFIRHAYGGEVQRAQADVAAAREGLAIAQAAAAAQLQRLQSQLSAALARRRLVDEQLLPAAQRVADGAELAYAHGATSALDLVDARRSLRAARLEQIDAQAQWIKTAADWQAATRWQDNP